MNNEIGPSMAIEVRMKIKLKTVSHLISIYAPVTHLGGAHSRFPLILVAIPFSTSSGATAIESGMGSSAWEHSSSDTIHSNSDA